MWKRSWEQRGWCNSSAGGELRGSDLPEVVPDTISAGRERGWSIPSPGPAEDKEAAAQVAPRPAAPGRGPGGLQVVLLSREAALRREIPAGAREGALGNACIYSSQVCRAHQLRGRGSASRA